MKKRKTSRQKEKDSKQKENHTAKRKRLAAKFLRYREDILILISFAMRSWLFFLPWGYSFCREANSFAVTVVGHRTVPLKSSVPEDYWFFNMWVFVRTSTNFAHLTSFQAKEFMDWPVPKTLDISVCQTCENKAFKMQHSVTVVRPLFPAKNEDTISSHPQSPRFPLGRLALWPP